MNLQTFATRIKELADGKHYTAEIEFQEFSSGEYEYRWRAYIADRGYKTGPNPLAVIGQFKPAEAPTE